MSVGGLSMSTFTQLVYHIVFSTKNRMRSLELKHKERFLSYICGVMRNDNSHVYQINMVEDHIHILCSVHCQMNVSDLVKHIKNATNTFNKQEKLFPMFEGWQKGYGAFTVNWKEKNHLIKYIKNQEEHHKHQDFITEYKDLLNDFGVCFEEKYL